MSAGSQLTVWRAGPDDGARLLAFCNRSGDGPHWPPSAWAALLGGGEAQGRQTVVLLLSGEDGGVQGWVAGSVLGDTAEVEFLLVDPEQRGRGLGRGLLEALLAWARNAGATELLLEARPSNEAAQRLYRSVGFAVQGRRAAYYRDPVEDALCMRLGL